VLKSLLLQDFILLEVALSTKNQSINQSIVKADIHARVLKMKTCR
jgi:sulfur transfer complex TusBCD TusB component (DsrH family)